MAHEKIVKKECFLQRIGWTYIEAVHMDVYTVMREVNAIICNMIWRYWNKSECERSFRRETEEKKK